MQPPSTVQDQGCTFSRSFSLYIASSSASCLVIFCWISRLEPVASARSSWQLRSSPERRSVSCCRARSRPWQYSRTSWKRRGTSQNTAHNNFQWQRRRVLQGVHTSMSLSVESRTAMRSLYRWTKAMRLSWLGPFWPFLAAGDLCIFSSGRARTGGSATYGNTI